VVVCVVGAIDLPSWSFCRWHLRTVGLYRVARAKEVVVLPGVDVLHLLLLPRPDDRPAHDDAVLVDHQHGRVTVLTTLVRTDGAPLALVALYQVEQVDRVVGPVAQVLQAQQVAGQRPTVDVAEAGFAPGLVRPGARLGEGQRPLPSRLDSDRAAARAVP